MTPQLEYKIQHSIELLKKAERLAKMYDPENGYYLAFSGGKDSQALYHIAVLAGVPFRAHFAPTTVDPPALIRFIRKNYPDVEFGKVEKNIYDMAVEKQILPTMRVRWCCAEYKEMAGAGKVTLIGIRHEESVRRSRRKEVEISSRKFSGSFEEFEGYREEVIRKKYKNLNFDQFAEHKEQMVSCINGKDSILVSPIIDWTSRDVWEFLNEVVKVPHCELYDRGYHRIGCICCPMSSRKQKLKEIKDYPHVKAKWIDAIKRIRMGGGITVRTYTPPQYRRTQSTIGGGQKWAYIKAAEPSHWLNPLGIDTPSRHSTRGGQWLERTQECGRGISLTVTKEPIPNTEELENQIAENIFDWWISGKAYEEWYEEKFHPALFNEE